MTLLIEQETCSSYDAISRAIEERKQTHHSFFEHRSSQAALLDIEDTAIRIVYQLTHGCGRESCRNIACYTGRSHMSAAPVRKHTARSARFIAIAMLSEGCQDDKICCREVDIDAATQISEDAGPIDTTSVAQLISETRSIKAFTNPEQHPPGSAERSLLTHRDVRSFLRTLREKPFKDSGMTNPLFVSCKIASTDLRDVVLYVINSLIPRLAELEINKELFTDLDSDDQRYDIAVRWATSSASYEPTPDLVEMHTDLVTNIKELCSTFAMRSLLSRTLMKLNDQQFVLDDTFGDALGDLVQTISRTGCHISFAFFIRVLIMIFAQIWDGSAVITRGTAAHGMLQLANMLLKPALPSATLAQPLSLILANVGVTELAQSWLDHDHESGSTQHLLCFHSLVGSTLLQSVFVAINHIKMRSTRASNTAIRAVTAEFLADSIDTAHGRASQGIELLQQPFLTLRVRRTHLVEDAFDQLWERPTADLLRPLRVRLVEIDGRSIGQDAGGVQLEFFNALIKDVMSEESGFFTTNESGLAYFRPGSLQPLHMFRHIGTLFGLALFNRIALAVRFPRVLYETILQIAHSCPAQSSPYIDDRWSQESKIISQMIRNDITDWQVPYEFNLTANGLYMSVSQSALMALNTEASRHELTYTLTVNTIVSEDGKIPITNLENLQWPGWRIVLDSQEDTPMVGEETKHMFANQLQTWLSFTSVLPQITAFAEGFTTVIDYRSLDLLHDADILKGLVEGSSTFDMLLIKQRTSYEGFREDEQYIGLFWSVLESWSEEQQKEFVHFVTAVEQISAFYDLSWKIAKDETASWNALPTSSTCYSTLHLPIYPSREVLEEKLLKAAEFNSYGFGIS